jgi:hypothetical protein
MFLRLGRIDSLDEHLAAYHCNHTRTPTIVHGTQELANDQQRFFYDVDRADLPAQRSTWGLAADKLEAIEIRERVSMSFAGTVTAAIRSDAGSTTASDRLTGKFGLSYDSGHVLAFVADAIVVSAPEAKLGYLGANPVLARMLGALVRGLGRRRRLDVANPENIAAVEELGDAADVLIVDLGVDISDPELTPPDGPYDQGVRLPNKLTAVFAALERLVELERARLGRGERPRRFVLINSEPAYWEAYVAANMDCSYGTFHSRVRRAVVKLQPDEGRPTREALARASRFVRWASRKEGGAQRMPLRAGKSVAIGDLRDYRGFGAGWAFPEKGGIWTQGTRSELAVALEPPTTRGYRLAFSVGSVCAAPGATLRVVVLVNGTPAGVRDFIRGSDRDLIRGRAAAPWRVELPPYVLAETKADLAFLIEDPRTPLELGWSGDERLLGILVRTMTLQEVGRLQKVRDSLADTFRWSRTKIDSRRRLRRLRRRLRSAYFYLGGTLGFRRHFSRLRRQRRQRRSDP